MGTMASQITSLTIDCSTVYSCAGQRKHQSSTSLAFVRGIHRWQVNSPHKGPVTRKMSPFDDVIMPAYDKMCLCFWLVKWKFNFKFFIGIYNHDTGLTDYKKKMNEKFTGDANKNIHRYIHTYIHTYRQTDRQECLLLLISMLWHRQAIFESKGDKLSFSAECRIRTWKSQDTNSPADWMPTHKPTELSRIKLKQTQQPVPIMSEHSAHLTSLPFGFRTWLWRYTCLLFTALNDSSIIHMIMGSRY